jgi:hypothetical protein
VATTSFILSILIALILGASSVADFTHSEKIVASMKRFGLPNNFEIVVGLVKIAATAGLTLGLFIAPHGHNVLTHLVAWCLLAYFVLATTFHVRAKDAPAEAAPAVVLAIVAVALALVA